MTDLRKAAEIALEALSEYTNVVTSGTDPTKWDEVVDGGGSAREAIRRLQDALSNPSKLEWFPAPAKTEWGEGMVCAMVEIDDNHYFDVFCEEWQKENVELMLGFTKREWVGLTDEDKDELLNLDNWTDIVEAVEAKLKEKNT